MSDIINPGNKRDKWTLRASELINWLYNNKSAVLVEGDNITLTPQQDGTVEISASGGGSGNVADVQIDGSSILDQDGVANIETMTGATAQASGEGGLVPQPASSDKDKFLKGDGTWANASNVAALNDLSDVDLSSPTDGQALVYDSANQEWVNGSVGGNVDDVQMNGQSIVTNKVASFKSYVELTQAQYDALPASKFTDDILYCIKDNGIVEGDQFAPVIYSPEEREIGTWIDGKPLYQKTVISNINQSTGFTYIDTGISNIDEIVNVFGSATYGNNDWWLIFPYSDGDDNNISLASRISRVQKSTGRIAFYLGANYTGSYVVNKVRFTVQYTKTTDVPGSGSWGTDGVPMMHYDGDEKIIGTWFGETLYERTINSSVPITDGSWNNNVLGTSGSGILIRKYDGIIKISGNSMGFSYNYYWSASEFVSSQIVPTGDDIDLYPKLGVNAKVGTVTIQYTKTT